MRGCFRRFERPEVRGESPSPGFFAFRAKSDLSPQAGRGERYAISGNLTASIAALPRIMSDALSAIISVEALRLAEIIRGITEASTTRRPCKPWTRSWSSTTAHLASAGPIRQVQPGWKVVVPRSVAACRNSSSLCTLGPGKSS